MICDWNVFKPFIISYNRSLLFYISGCYSKTMLGNVSSIVAEIKFVPAVADVDAC